jgi:hypothetical protein
MLYIERHRTTQNNPDCWSERLVAWLLGKGQQLPWLLWPAHLIVIAEIMFADLHFHLLYTQLPPLHIIMMILGTFIHVSL